MITGRSPFQSANENELFMKIRQDPVSFKLNKNLVGSKVFHCWSTFNFGSFQIISNEAKQIITALLVKVKNIIVCFQPIIVPQSFPNNPDIWTITKQEPKDRLGTVREGEDGKDDHHSLKSNNFFKGVDWKGLEEVNKLNYKDDKS